jgi:hypothetical protein
MVLLHIFQKLHQSVLVAKVVLVSVVHSFIKYVLLHLAPEISILS